MPGYRTNEVYFEDVRVPTEALVGEENRGWYYAAHALDRERISIFTVSGVRAVYDQLIEWARSAGPAGRAIEDEGIRNGLANYRIEIEVLQHLSYRILDMLKRDESPNYEASQVKVFSTEMMQRLQNFSLHAMGLYGQLEPGDPRAPIDGSASNGYMAAVMPTFGAGANELQRNIMAQRGLGLPRI